MLHYLERCQWPLTRLRVLGAQGSRPCAFDSLLFCSKLSLLPQLHLRAASGQLAFLGLLEEHLAMIACLAMVSSAPCRPRKQLRRNAKKKKKESCK